MAAWLIEHCTNSLPEYKGQKYDTITLLLKELCWLRFVTTGKCPQRKTQGASTLSFVHLKMPIALYLLWKEKTRR